MDSVLGRRSPAHYALFMVDYLSSNCAEELSDTLAPLFEHWDLVSEWLHFLYKEAVEVAYRGHHMLFELLASLLYNLYSYNPEGHAILARADSSRLLLALWLREDDRISWI